MILNYSDEKVIKDKKSIFLAGPVPRTKDIIDWRMEAITYFEKYNYQGIIYLPIHKEYKNMEESIEEKEWEYEALNSSNLIMFWIPRTKELLGLTTNVEFGYYLNKKNIIYGRPDDALNNSYLDWLYEKQLNKKPINNLEKLVEEAIKQLNN